MRPAFWDPRRHGQGNDPLPSWAPTGVVLCAEPETWLAQADRSAWDGCGTAGPRTAINFHVGAGTCGTSKIAPLGEAAAAFPYDGTLFLAGLAQTHSKITCGGSVLPRFPNLNFVVVERGVGGSLSVAQLD